MDLWSMEEIEDLAYDILIVARQSSDQETRLDSIFILPRSTSLKRLQTDGGLFLVHCA
jgi:hypothetical protein